MQELLPLARLLKHHRDALGLTHEGLHEKSNVSVRTISDMERGVGRRPRRSTINLLSKALELTAAQRDEFERTAYPPSPSPPQQATEARSSRLPHLPRIFVGRDEEQAALATLVRHETLVTLVGAGGCGKTSLAVAVGHALAEDFSGRAWFVPLAATTDATGIARAILLVGGARPPEEVTPEEALRAWCAQHDGLLILDNCEQVREECAALIATIHETNERWHILATSRRPFDLRGEVIHRVTPLALPGADATTPDAIGASAAVRLLLDVAGEDVALDARNATKIAALCRRLDGLPLALELAAARLRVYDPATVLEQIEEYFDLLGPAGVDRPPRHQTMHAIIDWSYNLLTAEERHLFRRLAVFEQGFTLAAAEAVCADPEKEVPASAPRLPRRAIAATLANLVDHSLVVVERTPQGNRFRLLETIRAFARQQAEKRGEMESLGARHARWYTARAELNPYPFDGGAAMRKWLDEQSTEQANIQRALRWAQKHDQEIGLRLVGALWSYWYLRGSHTEARAWLLFFIDAAPQESPHLAAALHGYGYLSHFYHLPTGREALIHALAIAEDYNDSDRITALCPYIAFTLSITGPLDQAKDYLERGWALIHHDETSHRKNIYQIIRGYIALAEGDHARGRRLLTRSARATQREDQPIYRCMALARLGSIELQQEEAKRAIETFTHLIVAAEDVGSWFYRYVGQNRLALAYESIGDLGAASAGIAKGLTLSGVPGGSRFEQGVACLAYGRHALYRGEVEEAAAHLEAAEAIITSIDHPVMRGELDYLLGLVRWEDDRHVAAQHLLTMLDAEQQRANILLRIEGIAWLAAKGRWTAEASRWLAAADALRMREAIVRPRVENLRYEATLAAIAASVGKETSPTARPDEESADLSAVIWEEIRVWLVRIAAEVTA